MAEESRTGANSDIIPFVETILNYAAICTLVVALFFVLYECLVLDHIDIYISRGKIGKPFDIFPGNTLQVMHAILCVVGCVLLVCVIVLHRKYSPIIVGSIGVVLVIIGIGLQIFSDGEGFTVHTVLGYLSLLLVIVVLVLEILEIVGVNFYRHMKKIKHLLQIVAHLFLLSSLFFGILVTWFYDVSSNPRIALLCMCIAFTTIWCTAIGILKFIKEIR